MKRRILAFLCARGIHLHKKLAYYDPQPNGATRLHYYCEDCGADWVEVFRCQAAGLEVWR